MRADKFREYLPGYLTYEMWRDTLRKMLDECPDHPDLQVVWDAMVSASEKVGNGDS